MIPMLRETGLGEWSVHPVHPDAIETLVGLGELDEAAALHAELEEYGRRLDRPWGIATAARSAALLASARGDDRRKRSSRPSERSQEHERLDWPLERARTLLVARRASSGGSVGAATPLSRLAEARASFVSLRNPLWLARVEAEESRLGGRRRSTRHADAHRGARRRARGAGAPERRDRRSPPRDPEDGRGDALARLPQARHPIAHGARPARDDARSSRDGRRLRKPWEPAPADHLTTARRGRPGPAPPLPARPPSSSTRAPRRAGRRR